MHERRFRIGEESGEALEKIFAREGLRVKVRDLSESELNQDKASDRVCSCTAGARYFFVIAMPSWRFVRRPQRWSHRR